MPSRKKKMLSRESSKSLVGKEKNRKRLNRHKSCGSIGVHTGSFNGTLMDIVRYSEKVERTINNLELEEEEPPEENYRSKIDTASFKGSLMDVLRYAEEKEAE